MQRHPDTLKAKSRTHQIVQVDDYNYHVTSGTSGETYYVTLFPDFGGSCSCDWAKYRPVDACGRSGCSHVLAVIAHRAAQEARTIAVHTDPHQAARQHRHTENVGDGLLITTRKAG